MRYWEVNLGPLKEQYLLWTTEPSLQPLNSLILNEHSVKILFWGLERWLRAPAWILTGSFILATLDFPLTLNLILSWPTSMVNLPSFSLTIVTVKCSNYKNLHLQIRKTDFLIPNIDYNVQYKHLSLAFLPKRNVNFSWDVTYEKLHRKMMIQW